MNKKLNRQLLLLLLREALSSFRPAGVLWVLFLAARGFSLFEIGVAEGFFHAVSFCCEVPSGMCADLLGRKRTLLASQLVFALSALLWLFSDGLVGVCFAMGVNALGYNLASGTREAITYDSLLQYGDADRYLSVSSVQNTVYHLGSAAALLCAGATVFLGWRVGYLIDLGLSAATALLTAALWEPVTTQGQAERASFRLRDLPAGLLGCTVDAARFLRDLPRAGLLMLLGALSGSVVTLYRFFLQDALPRAGAPDAVLGLLLVAVTLGSALGAGAAGALGRLSYRRAFLMCTLGAALGLTSALSGNYILMTAGGVLACVSDEALCVLTDAKLNGIIPSDRRATLVSVGSMVFSLVMIGLSPLAGLLADVTFFSG